MNLEDIRKLVESWDRGEATDGLLFRPSGPAWDWLKKLIALEKLSDYWGRVAASVDEHCKIRELDFIEEQIGALSIVLRAWLVAIDKFALRAPRENRPTREEAGELKKQFGKLQDSLDSAARALARIDEISPDGIYVEPGSGFPDVFIESTLKGHLEDVRATSRLLDADICRAVQLKKGAHFTKQQRWKRMVEAVVNYRSAAHSSPAWFDIPPFPPPKPAEWVDIFDILPIDSPGGDDSGPHRSNATKDISEYQNKLLRSL